MINNQKGIAHTLVLVVTLGGLAFLVAATSLGLFPGNSEALVKPTPTPTSTPMPSPSSTPLPTSTPDPNPPSGWHAPTDHEHGDAPPQWVLGSQWQPFTQSRENHRGYKGVLASMSNGVESYLIAHIFSTVAARSHGDHDFQLWVKEPDGTVSHWGQAGATNTSVLDFGTARLCIKDATRPSIESFVSFAPVEAWYTKLRDQIMLELNWIISGSNEPFCPNIPVTDGSVRVIDWHLNKSMFPGPYAQYVSPTLAGNCLQTAKGCVFDFYRVLNDYAEAPMAFPN